jgi:hypothetical protein
MLSVFVLRGSEYNFMDGLDEKQFLTSSANLIKIVVLGRCCPSMGTKCAVTLAGKPAPSRTPCP